MAICLLDATAIGILMARCLALDSVQPPDEASIVLRDEADQALQDASNQLSGLPSGSVAGDQDGMRQALYQLDDTLTKVQNLHRG